MHSYATVTTLLGTSVLNITGTAHETRARTLLEQTSQEIDRYLNRQLQPRVGTYYFSGKGGRILNTPDLIAVVSIIEDNNNDGSFDTTWGANDYFLAPYNAQPTNQEGRPFQWIEVSTKSNGTQDEFWRGQRNYQIVGTFGYVHATLTIGLTVSSSISATATSIPVSGSASGTIDAGHTLIINGEHIYVRSVSGAAATVTRAQNGSTPATLASGSAIVALQYPTPVVEATVMHAGRLFKRALAAFASQDGAPDGGFTMFRAGLDYDVRDMLQSFRKPSIGV